MDSNVNHKKTASLKKMGETANDNNIFMYDCKK